MPPDHNGVATFRIGKRRWASWPLYAGSRAPSQASRSPLMTLTPVRTPTATHVPLTHYGASTKASQMFNATPTLPRRDFDCGCLLSLCFYDLLETPQLPTTPRPYGNGLWCWPSLISPPF